ncbi:hypothetical protein CFC21_111656 [Triticum aestivum]|uniref:Tyrosinase copper-binding domain-containing protein n=3 Tax=Triticinae TaxID=1648030 RepID=A0A453T7Y1_AEGTS|nr:uncharacterized protein LOC123168855 [Triticum aestivum]KAF7111674.1 hypothetical protein CFC21_111656 [Triticum aestivum]
MKWRKVLKEAYTLETLQTVCRFIRCHPSVLCLLLCLLILYKYYFSWLSLLVATSPIFLFTGLFLGVVLTYGEPNNPENDHIYKKIEKAPQTWNIHNTAKPIEDVSIPRIISSEERIANHNINENKFRKGSHSRGSSSESASSASDGSEIDTHPMLHAFHQLRSAASSSVSSQDGNSIDSNTEDETGNQERNDENELEEKESVKVVAWTADDQKSILKIGCLEIERNQRLETLIGRRARKYVGRNLREFGNNEPLPTKEELSKFNVQIPTIFAPRRNPFDLPYNEDNFPESAPSAPIKMINAFDITCEQEDESSSTGGANSSNVEPTCVASQIRNITMLRRHESFTEGAPFLANFRQDLQPSRFKPYFVTENMSDEGTTVPSLQGEASEKSSVQDLDNFSVNDQEIQNVLLSLDIETPLLISDSSDDDMYLPGGHINDWVEAQNNENLNLSHATPLEGLSVVQYPQEMETTSNDLHQMSPHSNDLDLMPSSTEATEPFACNNNELPGKEVETLDDTQMGDPVNDSSPSGSDKPTFMSSPIDAVLLHEGYPHTAATSKEEMGLPSMIEVPSSEIASPSLASLEESRQNKTSEIRDS